MTHIRLGRKLPAFSLDVDFPVAPGITAIYGPAETGKSLLLELVGGFRAPDSGRILFHDAIVFDAAAGVSVPARRRDFGYLPPRDSLFPHLSLRQNLIFAAQRFPRLDRHRRVTEWLERFQLSATAESFAHQLSSEQRLRGALARLLIAEPRLLLLDNAGLSESLLLQVRSSTTAPILFASRDLDLCCAVASYMVVLEHGRVVQAGAPREVLDRPAGVEAARLVGIPNLFSGAIAALDPGRNSSLVELEHFAVTAPYLPAHFRGDRIWVAIRPSDLRVHATATPNSIRLGLVGVSMRAAVARLEFEHEVFADLSLETYAAQKDNKEWHVEFPPAALRML